MAQIKHENDKYQVRITVAVRGRERHTHRVAYACIHFNIFFFMVITHKENNLNLYSTPTLFCTFFMLPRNSRGEKNQKLFHRLLLDFKMFIFYFPRCTTDAMSQFIR